MKTCLFLILWESRSSTLFDRWRLSRKKVQFSTPWTSDVLTQTIGWMNTEFEPCVHESDPWWSLLDNSQSRLMIWGQKPYQEIHKTTVIPSASEQLLKDLKVQSKQGANVKKKWNLRYTVWPPRHVYFYVQYSSAVDTISRFYFTVIVAKKACCVGIIMITSDMKINSQIYLIFLHMFM